MGMAANKAQMNAYKRDAAAWYGQEAGKASNWANKLGRHKVQVAENVLAHSRQVGGIQRQFGLTKDKYMQDNENAYRQLVQSSKVNEGGRAAGFGRNTQLAYLYGSSARDANLRRAGVQQTEMLNASSRQLLSMQNRAATQRGLPAMRGVAPAKPVFPGPLEYLANNAAMLVGVASGVQDIGQGMGKTGGFWGTGPGTQNVRIVDA